jgi:hypothetical protein
MLEALQAAKLKQKKVETVDKSGPLLGLKDESSSTPKAPRK